MRDLTSDTITEAMISTMRDTKDPASPRSWNHWCATSMPSSVMST
ncbi:hypothetical protein [Streptomyces antimycoticus]|nr:hypothetical protein [Streptomyces antimycoticus]